MDDLTDEQQAIINKRFNHVKEKCIKDLDGQVDIDFNIVITVKEPIYVQYRKLRIFSTQFGKALEEFITRACKDSTIIDDTFDVIPVKHNQHKHNEKQCKNDRETKQCEYKIQFNKKHLLIKGYVQSGKTMFIICMAIKYLMFGISSIILLRNFTGDQVQIEERFEKFRNTFFKKFSNDDYIMINIEQFCEYSNVDDIRQMLSAKVPKIVFILVNKNAMKKITDQIDYVDPQYTLMIDECDDNCSPTAEQYYPLISKLIDNSRQTLEITATTLGTIGQHDIYSDCVRELSTKKSKNGLYYIGLGDLKYIEIDTGTKNVPNTSDINEVFKVFPYLEKHLHEIAYDNSIYSICYQGQAMFDLVQVTHYINTQETLFKYNIKKYPHVAAVIMTEGSIKVYHPSLGNERFKIGKYFSRVENFVHTFSHRVDVGSVLTYLENKGFENIQRGVIFVGNKGNRGVSFSSTICDESNDYGIRRWHIKRMIAKFPQGISQDEAQQRAGRLCGNMRPIGFQIFLGNKTDCESVVKGYETQEHLLNITSRMHGKIITKTRKFNNKKVKTKVWKQNDNVEPQLVSKLIKNKEVSSFIHEVSGKTKTGRDKIIICNLTKRNSLNPKWVQDDGVLKKEDFMPKNFKKLENSTSVAERVPVNGRVGRMTNDTVEGVVYLYIKNNGPSDYMKIYNNADWSNLKNGTPTIPSVHSRCIELRKKGILSKSGKLFSIV